MIERWTEYGVSVHHLPLIDALKALEDAGFVRIVRTHFESYHQASKDGLPFKEWLAEIIEDQFDCLAQDGKNPLTNVPLRIILAVEADYQNYPDAVADMLENKRRETSSFVSDQWSKVIISF